MKEGSQNMLWVENEIFENESVKLDFNRWRGCTFNNCEIVVEHGVFDLVGCTFNGCKFTATGHAIAILKIFKVAYPTIPVGEDAKNPVWVFNALNWINKANPESVKKWVYEELLKKE